MSGFDLLVCPEAIRHNDLPKRNQLLVDSAGLRGTSELTPRAVIKYII